MSSIGSFGKQTTLQLPYESDGVAGMSQREY